MKRTPLKRKTALRKRNPERMKRKRYDEDGFKHTYGPQFEWLSEQPCCLQGVKGHVCSLASPAHHLVPVGQGGKDSDGMLPVCAQLHTEFHSNPITAMEQKYKVSFTEMASYYEELWQKKGAGG